MLLGGEAFEGREGNMIHSKMKNLKKIGFINMAVQKAVLNHSSTGNFIIFGLKQKHFVKYPGYTVLVDEFAVKSKEKY